MTDNRRLIEDYLPIQAISAEASREKSVRKGHISTLHLWWARRPLVACRAAVYGALVPASRFVPENAPDNKKQSLGRANAAKFVESLCKYPGNLATIIKAQDHILEAHAERLTLELEKSKAENAKPAWVEEFNFIGEQVTADDIQSGRAPRPRILDMFAGGGAIPLEALRLGCETYATDLNPVAYIIELCTLVYPQKYGKPDLNALGMTGPKNEKGETTWGGLANEVRYWGGWILKKVKSEIGDLYPIIPDPEFKGNRKTAESKLFFDEKEVEVPPVDEIHKYSRWRQVVKGLFDKRGDELQILVSGSARLDYYRRGGDSLQGRYHFYRLFPLSCAELGVSTHSTVQDLLVYGGFPEPFLLQSEKESRRWSREYRSRVIQGDLSDLEHVQDVGMIERMVIRLPDLVGSPLSLNPLREDLQVSHQSVTRWMGMLENLYMVFRIYPFGAPKIRAVKKESKHYHLDWTVVSDMGLRFENLVACHLLKWIFFVQDTESRNIELRYFRDVDKREVDFVIVEEGAPSQFIECKSSGKAPNPSLSYLKARFPSVPAAQLTLDEDMDLMTKEGIRICSSHLFLKDLV